MKNFTTPNWHSVYSISNSNTENEVKILINAGISLGYFSVMFNSGAENNKLGHLILPGRIFHDEIDANEREAKTVS